MDARQEEEEEKQGVEDEKNPEEGTAKMQTNHFILLTVSAHLKSLDGNVNVVSMIKKKEQKEEEKKREEATIEMEMGKCCLRNPTLQFSNSFAVKGQRILTPQSSPNLPVAK